MLIRNHQIVHINNHYKQGLSKNLNLKQDKAGLLRAYGRLNKSDLDTLAKNPIIIVPNTDLSRLIIDDADGIYHKGIPHTMSDVRQMCWIARLREQVKKRVRQCPCQKMNNLPYKYPKMTDLPANRVTRARTFQHIDLDYFGPMTVFREDMVKTNVYGCIFTCAITRLIHLELVPDGTAEKFINAFRRFVARQGEPDTVTFLHAHVCPRKPASEPKP
ncbi:hypothetical protein RB195_014648 [Necator americanus]|uniref:Integrase zinc-binding domain-containing protein n=1 Tax=Necator americanus TaxID=51031 RepID=A0ABR1E113_NECAM